MKFRYLLSLDLIAVHYAIIFKKLKHFFRAIFLIIQDAPD